jgi:hypothetical protein
MANNRKSINLLPAFFRTEKNNKFLSSTLDQLISVPQLNRIDAYIGSKDTPTYKSGDVYITDTNPLREAYQLEPALVVKTLDQEIKKAFALDDLLNQINIRGGDSSNLDRLLNPKFFPYDPKIDWDKFINFRSYYWLPNGPDAVLITGNQRTPTIEFSVTDNSDGIQFLFGGLQTTENLTLYRGYTYVFNIDSTHNFYIKYTNRVGADNQVTGPQITGNGTNKGQIVFTVDWTAPERLFYTSNDNQLSTGNIIVKQPRENSIINVDEEIVGKQSYTTTSGLKLINGLKVRFEGTVFPESYRDTEFIVEGVGKSIKLVNFKDLDTPDNIAEFVNSRFDGTNFDTFPFDDFKNIPLVPEYVTINKSSHDRNPWSRYNRWFHKDVIVATANNNGTLIDFPEQYRALRPIVEFVPNIELFNFGRTSIQNIDLIDNVCKNAFAQVEGQVGYYIDGVLLEEGFRVIFNGDQDPLVRNKVYRVTFSKDVSNSQIINLVEESDIIEEGVAVLIKQGLLHGGASWHHNGSLWLYSQQRTSRNQSPLFDLFDADGNSYSDTNVYSTNFTGNKIFGYGTGSGSNDPILGFPLLYRNVGVEGTFLFKNYFSTEEFLLVRTNDTQNILTAGTYFKINSALETIWIASESYSIGQSNGIYDIPLNLTNNPLNSSISQFTLTELSDHLTSMISRDPAYDGTNLKDLPNISKYGTKLISNLNPLSFAHHFITDQENNLIDATRLVGEHYYQFKFNLIKSMIGIQHDIHPSIALDSILDILNKNKTTSFPYYYSDMLPCSNDAVIREYKVTDSRNIKYALPSLFSASTLNSKAVLVYLNDVLLLHKKHYTFDRYDANVQILVPLERGDSVRVKEYSNTNGSFVPPTPTKLGLYPKFEPKMYLDDTVAGTPVNVIQGHDGSITVAFNDYRDAILLEFETRIFNNIKTEYNSELFDINHALPGIFRNQEYSYDEIFKPVYRDFLKWRTTYSVETEKNLTFNIDNPRTYNFNSVVLPNGNNAPGNWRAIFKLYFDTDRPHIAPWEMLGFGDKPDWWESEYGPAPYTSGNELLWEDLEKGIIRDPKGLTVNSLYVRPGLSAIIPVDENGNLLDIRSWGILGEQSSLSGVDVGWTYGDCGPAETSWRRSSYWPYAVQIIMAVCKPALYAGVLFDTSRMIKNPVGNYVYSEDNVFVSPSRVLLPLTVKNGSLVLTSGYSVFVIEAGIIRNSNYVNQLSIELTNSNFNLMNKVGGFVSKDKLEIIIESVDPNSVNPGILLPAEDYTIHFNVSNPIKTISISGIIVQKYQGKFVVRGYDKIDPYFEILVPLHQKTDPNIVVGATPEDYSIWSTNVFYSQGQVITYDSSFYRVIGNHNSGQSFNPTYYRMLPTLPSVGGTAIQHATEFETTPSKVIYGTTYETLQEVADLLSGYGQWLESQGFVFDDYNTDLGNILDWTFTIKEFLFWATQNWAENSIIALSPFANTIKYKFVDSIVDNIFNSFYDYSLLRADATAFPADSFTISRVDGTCSISSNLNQQGFFFARLHLIQKEHAIIFNNTSRFNDVIYDIETGYRQRRVRLIGFKTTDWNGDYFSPGFIYDPASIHPWVAYEDYIAGDIVEYTGNYYSLKRNLTGKEKFDFNDWNKLDSKPQATLIPNFEYKISQFEDFYSLDIDNFDVSQQQLAQHLTGYSPRVYLDNIFLNPVAQYKFYQGFIKEKGTKNALDKLAKASVHNLNGKIIFNEEWAFRVGAFGAFSSEREIEFPMSETKFVDNSQLIKFLDQAPTLQYDATVYVTPTDLTIKPLDYKSDSIFSTIPGTVSTNNLVLPVAGYVRLDDVDFALKTKNDLYSFAPGKTIQIGDTIWIGFDDNQDWGVYRYSRLPQVIISATADVYGQRVIFKTDVYHTLKVGDIVAISRFSESLNGIYKIDAIPHLNEFIVNTPNEIDNTNDFGILFKFVSSRYNQFDDLASAEYVPDIIPGKSIWVDNQPDGKWQVYKKINNYNVSKIKSLPNVPTMEFGQHIISKESNNLVIVSAPAFQDDAGSGKVFVYTNTDGVLKLLTYYGINAFQDQFYRNSTETQPALFGKSMDYDSADGIIVVGAPYASNIRLDQNQEDTRYINATNGFASEVNAGMVVISTIDPVTNRERIAGRIMLGFQYPANYQEFGHSVYIGSTSTRKILLVGAPGDSTDTGAVFSYDVAYTESFEGQTVEVNTTATSQQFFTLPQDITYGARFGEKIAGDLTGKVVAISVPGYDGGNGAVCIYTNTSSSGTYTFLQTIKWDDLNSPENMVISTGSSFGSVIDMDDSGKWLFISAYNSNDNIIPPGKVLIYNNTTGTFSLTQVISNPSTVGGLKFGFSLESDDTGEVLGVTSIGPVTYSGLVFDTDTTTFDSGSTKFSEYIPGAGTAYTFNRYNGKFVFASELIDAYVTANSYYGTSISVNRNAIYVGAPFLVTTSTVSESTTYTGNVYVWEAINPNSNSWELVREQTDLIDVSRIKQVKTIDTFNEQIGDYLEFYDPAKGKIPQAADQELRYRTVFDPAVYNTGTDTSVVVDVDMFWAKDRVGELWWDLSSVKYMWYEQGDVEFRKNNWGAVFPGCTIDICEWISTPYLPSQWVENADTALGLAEGISGQPKYSNDSAYVVEQTYSPNTDSFVNTYYYWVKNTVVVPNRQGRTISAFEVANLILDPKSSGLKYIQALSTNALSAINIKGSLVNSRISLNLHLDTITNSNNKHTEWLLIEEGSPHSLPNRMLEKKLFDSILGRDSLGNSVPDKSLSERQRYGIDIRPRQSMFKNRLNAVRNLIDYVNSIFADNLIVDFYSLENLKFKDEISSVPISEYDLIVEDLEKRDTIYTGEFVQAKLNPVVLNGRIESVEILNAGFGYGKNEISTYDDSGNPITWKGPSVKIFDDINGAEFDTAIDSNGSIVSVVVLKSGQNYSSVPVLYVRPYTVLVQTDRDSRGRWSRYSLMSNKWVKIQTQGYDTTLYWDYVNWVSADYNPYQTIIAYVDETYELQSLLDLAVGDYVKVKNNGSGRYLILKKIETGVVGTFNESFDVLVSENGTIKIKDSIWDIDNSVFGWDQISPYDQTFFDQVPDQELEKILDALKNNIFIGNLKVYWNKFFFAAVKYALTEQKVVDWAFKTSFINVTNQAGELTQRPIYKFQDTEWYEDYLKEIKPYHTQVREYKLGYTVIEPTNSFTTDFDLPVSYDRGTGQYISLTVGDPLLQQYPYKGWFDNYTLSLSSIVVTYGGEGYREIPEIKIIASPTDTITRTATANAIIASGKIIGAEIIDAGAGYTSNPTIVFVGGSPTTPAIASPIMTNGKVRVNTIGLKFDRISRAREIGTKSFTDQFIADGVQVEYNLSWLASADRTNMEVSADGIFVNPAEYTVEDFKEFSNGYNKLFTKLILNAQYQKGTIVKITYDKSLKIYNAYDRIQDYYNPSPGMPGKTTADNYAQLMSGMEYAGTELSQLPFETDFSWDSVPFGSLLWDPSSSQTIGLDTIYDGGAITTSTPWIIGSWTAIDGKTTTTSTPWVSVTTNTGYWSLVTVASTSTPWVQGHWSTKSVGALGTGTEEVILDGDTFISPIRTYAPEELIPGHVTETLGINIFSRQSSGSSLIYRLKFPGVAGLVSTIQLTMPIPSLGSIFVTYDNKSLLAGNDYSYSFDTKTLTVANQPQDGSIEVIYMPGVGGTEFLSSKYVTDEGSAIISVIGDCSYAEARSIYVTLNGYHVDLYNGTGLQPTYYILSEVDGRPNIAVHGAGTGLVNTVFVAFFASKYKGFSEAREEIFDDMDANNRTKTLSQPPGVLGPSSANSIVEVNGVRIVPPNTTYYEITNTDQTAFDISTRRYFPHNSFDMTMLEIYKNGVRIPLDTYYLDQYNNQVIFPDNYFDLGDVLAITAIVDYDYIITGNILEITNRIPLDAPTNKVRVITFTNQNSSFIRTEVYLANSARLYKLSRIALNVNYIWVSIGDKTLVPGYDYYILEDLRSIQLDVDIPFVEGEQVIVTSFSETTSNNSIGFKMFKDSIGRVSYSRLSLQETTYLIEPLQISDTQIVVENGDVLPDITPNSSAPGVIFIAGERIEYLEKTGNVLSRIKRATFGTGAKEYYTIGSWVIDQSRFQAMPIKDTLKVITTTTNGDSSYLLSNEFKFSLSARYHDQIEVYFGGRLLEKPTAPGVVRYSHNFAAAYDSGTANTVLQPGFTITTSTVNSSTVYTLNLPFNPPVGIELKVVQRGGVTWYADANKSLITNSSVNAVFLRDRDTITVDQLYYGGDPTLRFADGSALTFDDGRPIKGY